MKRLMTILISCALVDAIQSLRPGAVWNLSGGTYDGIVWMDGIQIKPTKQEISQAQSDCKASQVLLQAYSVELSTTIAAVASVAQEYASASAITQANANKNMARIIQLKSILGMQ